MSKHKVHRFWLILAAYGVWFAVFSGLEELSQGKWWKIFLSLLLGIITYLIIEKKLEK
jgi:hypothetical protein